MAKRETELEAEKTETPETPTRYFLGLTMGCPRDVVHVPTVRDRQGIIPSDRGGKSATFQKLTKQKGTDSQGMITLGIAEVGGFEELFDDELDGLMQNIRGRYIDNTGKIRLVGDASAGEDQARRDRRNVGSTGWQPLAKYLYIVPADSFTKSRAMSLEKVTENGKTRMVWKTQVQLPETIE